MIDTVALKRRVLELAMTGKLSKYQLGDDKIGDVLVSNNSDYLQKARKYGHFTGYKN